MPVTDVTQIDGVKKETETLLRWIEKPTRSVIGMATTTVEKMKIAMKKITLCLSLLGLFLLAACDSQQMLTENQLVGVWQATDFHEAWEAGFSATPVAMYVTEDSMCGIWMVLCLNTHLLS